MAVFTKPWVERNLSEFLDGHTASAIVTLGRDAIEAKEQEEALESEISDLRKSATEAEGRKREIERKIDKVAREAQDAIESQLRAFNYRRFSKNKFSLPKVKDDLSNYRGEFPDENNHADSLKRLGEGVPDAVAEVPNAPHSVFEKLTGLQDFLRETPTRVALTALEGHPEQQSWVERGIGLHEALDECLFCTGRLTAERRRELSQHFDESWLQLRQRATELLESVRSERHALVAWLKQLPEARDIASDLRATYAEQVKRIGEEVDRRCGVLSKIEEVLQAKSEDPSVCPTAPDCALLNAPLPTTVISRAAAEHNEQVGAHIEVTEQHVTVVLDHLIGSRSEGFRDLQTQLSTATEKSTTSRKAAELAERTLTDLRQKQFSSAAMAETLTKDLARVYGKNHLSVVVTNDGKSYSCRRGSVPATNLSDGERTTLSLLYFLRKLEDETDKADPAERIVVIDDPSSSLDREAIFATHQWLIDTLGELGQFIILTHDFSLLRLFIKSQQNSWGTSLRKISQGDNDERAFPRVSFLEMFASTTSDGARRTKLGELPQVLRKSTSEYAYLFSMVMEGIGNPADHEKLFLLPNAARRVLEVFASFKAPHVLGSFDQRLKALMDDLGEDPYRDVYDFCNRYSHGEGSESVDVLDARTVHQQIRRCMEFMKSVDSDHFARMCSATSVDGSILG